MNQVASYKMQDYISVAITYGNKMHASSEDIAEQIMRKISASLEAIVGEDIDLEGKYELSTKNVADHFSPNDTYTEQLRKAALLADYSDSRARNEEHSTLRTRIRRIFY